MIIAFISTLLIDTVALKGPAFQASRSVFFCAPKDVRDGFWWIGFQNDGSDRYIRVRGDGAKYGENSHLDVTLENPFKEVDRQNDNGAVTWTSELSGTVSAKPVTITLMMRQKTIDDRAVADFTAQANGVVYDVRGCIFAPTPASPRTAEFPQK